MTAYPLRRKHAKNKKTKKKPILLKWLTKIGWLSFVHNSHSEQSTHLQTAWQWKWCYDVTFKTLLSLSMKTELLNLIMTNANVSSIFFLNIKIIEIWHGLLITDALLCPVCLLPESQKISIMLFYWDYIFFWWTYSFDPVSSRDKVTSCTQHCMYSIWRSCGLKLTCYVIYEVCALHVLPCNATLCVASRWREEIRLIQQPLKIIDARGAISTH